MLVQPVSLDLRKDVLDTILLVFHTVNPLRSRSYGSAHNDTKERASSDSARGSFRAGSFDLYDDYFPIPDVNTASGAGAAATNAGGEDGNGIYALSRTWLSIGILLDLLPKEVSRRLLSQKKLVASAVDAARAGEVVDRARAQRAAHVIGLLSRIVGSGYDTALATLLARSTYEDGIALASELAMSNERIHINSGVFPKTQVVSKRTIVELLTTQQPRMMNPDHHSLGGNSGLGGGTSGLLNGQFGGGLGVFVPELDGSPQAEDVPHQGRSHHPLVANRGHRKLVLQLVLTDSSIDEALNGPCQNQLMFSEVLKTKFFKRLSAFYSDHEAVNEILTLDRRGRLVGQIADSLLVELSHALGEDLHSQSLDQQVQVGVVGSGGEQIRSYIQQQHVQDYSGPIDRPREWLQLVLMNSKISMDLRSFCLGFFRSLLRVNLTRSIAEWLLNMIFAQLSTMEIRANAISVLVEACHYPLYLDLVCELAFSGPNVPFHYDTDAELVIKLLAKENGVRHMRKLGWLETMFINWKKSDGGYVAYLNQIDRALLSQLYEDTSSLYRAIPVRSHESDALSEPGFASSDLQFLFKLPWKIEVCADSSLGTVKVAMDCFIDLSWYKPNEAKDGNNNGNATGEVRGICITAVPPWSRDKDGDKRQRARPFIVPEDSTLYASLAMGGSPVDRRGRVHNAPVTGGLGFQFTFPREGGAQAQFQLPNLVKSVTRLPSLI
ncbi:hypothetical protein BASA81_003201 [Batrachochytrium salamandrivorans]|nr:hypothetical protein BASA81_003201 [Batrachochytrium salamandrivorans]